MSVTHQVSLKSMRFHGHVGVLPHEAEIAQSIEIDISVWVTRDDDASGAAGVLDYRRLYDVAARVISAGHVRYLEDLVDRIADEVIAYDGAERVVVAARKPNVALPGPLSHAEVSVERSR
ncbi:MAG TPA: dihydroneopterin aldolase [Gemmatimonadaceae bacterium]|nr:dihydroneopterin aldolase [Gemmatimonadaceae bacterium]